MSITRISRKCYDHILEQILNGELRQGAVVDRRRIADELGASRSPVSDAVNQLVAEGFLEVQPQVGTRVRVIDVEDLRGLFMIRLALECQAARFYCGDKIKEERSRLQPLADAVDTFAIRSRDRAAAEVDFHIALVELTGSRVYVDEFHKVMLKNNIYQTVMLFGAQNVLNPVIADSHSVLLDRLENSDPNRAEEAIREHLHFPIQVFLGNK